MPYPYFTKDLGTASTPGTAIPTLDRRHAESPAGYRPHPDLTHAVNVALLLGMPLLLTGEPGTGKTQLAYALSHEIGCPLFKFETKSTSQARDLFYMFDALTAFKMRETTDLRPFIRYQALGSAILEAFPGDDPRIAALLPPGQVHNGPRRSIVLIDEIDKAPRDFPNDLLNEIDRLYFRVPELQNLGTPGADAAEDGIPPNFKPIVVITSNSEKGLPDAFLRRCVYFDIPFPSEEEMREIVALRVAGLQPKDRMLADALDLFQRLRGNDRTVLLKKKPSTAELLNWLAVLLHRGAKPDTSLVGQKDLVLETICALVKSSDDRHAARAYITDRWASAD